MKIKSLWSPGNTSDRRGSTGLSLGATSALTILLTAVVAGSSAAQVQSSVLPQALTGGGTPPALNGESSPFTEFERFIGRYDVAVAVAAHDDRDGTAGTFNLFGIPVGATIERAWMGVTSFADTTPDVSATFAGNDLGAVSVWSSDSAGERSCSLYRFSVMSLVHGNGAYSYTSSGTTDQYGDFLVVAYEDPSLPLQTLVMLGGADALLDTTSTLSIDDLPAGNARLLLVSQADTPAGEDRVRLDVDHVHHRRGREEAGEPPSEALVLLRQRHQRPVRDEGSRIDFEPGHEAIVAWLRSSGACDLGTRARPVRWGSDSRVQLRR